MFRVSLRGEGASSLLTDDINLVVHAARLLAGICRTGSLGVEIRIHKRIPVAEGIVGGSADAAATLIACNQLWGASLGTGQLHTAATRLGADMPLLLHDNTTVDTGWGEKLRPVPVHGSFQRILALSHHGLFTLAVFRESGRISSPRPTRVDSGLLEALADGDTRHVSALLRNDLQRATFNLQPELTDVLAAGGGAGAISVLVSGSSPIITFLAGTKTVADAISDRLVLSSRVRAVRHAHEPIPDTQIVN